MLCKCLCHFMMEWAEAYLNKKQNKKPTVSAAISFIKATMKIRVKGFVDIHKCLKVEK